MFSQFHRRFWLCSAIVRGGHTATAEIWDTILFERPRHAPASAATQPLADQHSHVDFAKACMASGAWWEVDYRHSPRDDQSVCRPRFTGRRCSVHWCASPPETLPDTTHFRHYPQLGPIWGSMHFGVLSQRSLGSNMHLVTFEPEENRLHSIIPTLGLFTR